MEQFAMVITDIVHQISIYQVQKIYHIFLLNNIIFYSHDSLNSLYISQNRFEAVQGCPRFGLAKPAPL